MKRLTELNPQWVGCGGDGITFQGQPVPRREKIGVSFDCPCGCGTLCFIGFENPVDGQGPHNLTPGAHLWTREGDDFEHLTLRPSIQRADPDGCRWHGFITNGEATTC